MERFDVRPRDPDLPARNFSGGNQQKIVVAREIESRPVLLLVGEHPTRVAAREAPAGSAGASRASGRRLVKRLTGRVPPYFRKSGTSRSAASS